MRCSLWRKAELYHNPSFTALRHTTPSTLEQHYIFISSQVRETYAFYLLKNLAEITGAEVLVRPKRSSDEGSSNSKRKQRRNSQKKGKPSKKGGEEDDNAEDDEDDDAPRLPQTILFVSRCRTAAHLSVLLDELEIPNTPLHSHLSQRERLASLQAFRASRVPLLIATDVGSRGLDIPEVEVVINWDVPRDPDDYVHRIGRTARAGKRGTSITFVTEGDVDLVQGVEKRTGSEMKELILPEEEVLEDLNKVTTAKRIATMALHEEKFGEKQEMRKKKQQIVSQLEKSSGKRNRKKPTAKA